MGNVKDDGKKMDPLFPRLHITETDKGGPRTPPRNKMAISHQLNVPSQRCLTGSVSPILPLSNNNGSSLVPANSSYHVSFLLLFPIFLDASYKRSVFSSFGSSCGSTRLATRLDSYHSSGINLNISLTTVKQTIETTNCQTLCNGGHLKRGDYCLFKPQDFKSTNSPVKKPEDEDDYLVPSLSFGNGQYRGKFPTLTTNPHIKHPTIKPTDKGVAQDNKLNATTVSKEPVSYYSDRLRFSEMLSGELAPLSPRKTSILVDELQMLQDSSIRLPLKRKSFQETEKDGILGEPELGARKPTDPKWTLLGDDRKTDHEVLDPTGKCKQDDHGCLQLGDLGKNSDISETNFILCHNITPKEVSQIIGQEQYCKARRTIVQQQKVFQSQLFELHRLIKVQKLLAESPELLQEDNFYKLKKLPSSDDIFPNLDHHHRNETSLAFPIETTLTKPLHFNTPNPIELPSPPPPPPSTATKQPPWCFLPPPGNQWLVPVRSPSEGLVYKPYTGPYPPPVGLMAPIYAGEFITGGYNLPASYPQGIGVFPTTTQLYGSPTVTKGSSSPTMEDGLMKYNNKAIKSSCNIESEMQGSKGGDHELPLFPTTPTVQDSDQCTEMEKGYDENRIKVIKVVPHNPKLASESAARIFQFIQEERKQYD
ncbi:protein EARLY FLOWERING 3-like [Cynara cardunculus var. scolymus]|uniref:protein EARLY FLOWERING 3-like n=1 Tax=Cynara cardunculus var. scolymus TaxID=59895 RepID=UPI000D62E9F7|nr:protein EARLY FLOWERING 3-like [Cynara cardunculus var. scolymus]